MAERRAQKGGDSPSGRLRVRVDARALVVPDPLPVVVPVATKPTPHIGHRNRFEALTTVTATSPCHGVSGVVAYPMC